MSFQLTADQMADLFGSNWQSLTQGTIGQADPSSIVGKALAADGAMGAWQTAYLALYNDTSDITMDGSTGETYSSVLPGVDPSTWLWLQGAADANAGIGYFAQFIRDYTAAQYEARTGSTLDTSRIYIASADVARGVLKELLPRDPGADISLFGNVPDIFKIANNDAGAVGKDLFGGDNAPWSGALLFAYLGVGGLFEKLILKNPQNPFPGEGDISYQRA